MMQRLREQTSSSDRATARAAALLSVMPALDGDRMRRRPLPAADGARRTAGGIRSALVVAISLASVAAGAATLHRVGWLLPPPVPAQSAPSVAPSGPPDHAFVQPVSAVRPAPPPVERVEPAEAKSAGAAQLWAGRRPGTSRSSHAPSREAARAASGDDESALMMDAVRALRHDADPVRAEALADTAMQRYPHGAQAEEAMALAMEAASSRGDAVGARRAAQRYLESFHAGRFADRAQRILAAPAR
jgi:hypothetical protein